MTLLQTPTVSSQAGPLERWLHALRVSVPPVGLLHVGAGCNNPSAFSTLHSLYPHASQVLALEADAARASQLQAAHATLPQVQVRQAVIAGSGGRASLLRTSVSGESGLCPPEHLHAVWPRLKVLRSEDVEAVALAECWGVFAAATSGPGSPAEMAPNWLFIDCLPAAELLQGAPMLLANADVVVARAVQPAMAAGSSVAVPEHLSVAHLQSVLAKEGLHLLGAQEESHPALVLAVFVRDQREQLVQERARWDQFRSHSGKLAAQWEARQQELSSATLDAVKLAADRQAQIEELTKAREEQAKLVQLGRSELEELRQAKAAADRLLTERNGELDRVSKAAAQAEKVLREKLDRIDQLTKERDEQSQLAMQRQQEMDRLTKAHGEQLHLSAQRQDVQAIKQSEEVAKTRKSLEISLKKEVLNAAKQIEAYLRIQNYLNTGEIIGEMHGWPISPDFGIHLVELIESNDYGAIIEFGSGTSTVLIAKTIKHIAAKRENPPETIQIAFEHSDRYHSLTRSRLEQAGLSAAVRLELCPLREYICPNGQPYLYYDCLNVITELANKLCHSTLKMLLVVDGPPGTTGKHARYPALPIIIDSIKPAVVDIFLDDFRRSDEKEVANLWLADLAQRGWQAEFTEVPLEKGACLLHIVQSTGSEPRL